MSTQPLSKQAMEDGVRESECFLAIFTDDGKNSYLSRPMCKQEIRWAVEANKVIVPVCSSEDKRRIGDFIAQAKRDGFPFFAKLNFCACRSPAAEVAASGAHPYEPFLGTFDRSGPLFAKASLETIALQARRSLSQQARAGTEQMQVAAGGLQPEDLPLGTSVEVWSVSSGRWETGTVLAQTAETVSVGYADRTKVFDWAADLALLAALRLPAAGDTLPAVSKMADCGEADLRPGTSTRALFGTSSYGRLSRPWSAIADALSPSRPWGP